MRHSTKHSSERSVLHKKKEACFIHWKPVGKLAVWYYLLVNPGCEKQLSKVLKGKTLVRLEEYGQVLRWGYGEPSASVVDEMGQQYIIPDWN